MTLERGYLLNKRYRIMETLAQGGMASIYKAIDENLGVEVAVKENLFTTDDYARQFRREAVILASLRHPNLPRVTDHFVIEEQGQYLVMDYIEGEDLRQRMERAGVLTEEETIILGVAVCEALEYLHTSTPPVVHRDVKPGNVKITPDGHIYLVDFGLAKVMIKGGGATETGARAMTPGYSPPEQYGIAHTDHRTDIYSLGATLYSALTGYTPEDGLGRAMDQLTLTPIHEHDPKITRRLEMVIEKAMAVRPDERYQSAEEFRQELVEARTASRKRTPLELTLEPPPPPVPRQMPPRSVTSGVYQEPPQVEPAQMPGPLPVSTPASEPGILDPHPSEPQQPRRLGLFISLAAVLVLLGLITATYFISPAIGQRISGFFDEFAEATPTSIAARTTSPVIVSYEKTPTPLSTLTPTPTRLATRVPTRTPTITASPLPTALGGNPGQIAFASDRSGIPQIWLISVDGLSLKQITNIPEGACQPSWSPGGDKLVIVSPCIKEQESYSASSLFIVNADGSNVTTLPSEPGGDYDPAWSPDGKYIAFTSLRGDNIPKLYKMNLQTKETTLLASIGSVNMQPAWSPDSSKIAFVTNRNGPYQIWIMNSDGISQTIFTRSSDAWNTLPSWRHDGEVILFTQASGGIPNLYHASVNAFYTSGKPVYRDTSIPMRDGSYSPDNIYIAFESWKEGIDHDIYLMTTSGSDLHSLTGSPSYDFDPAFRPRLP